ncbi:MAG: TrmH family RNA methyltransferase [Clostridiaceae bacterium]|nr:TrmH family RNA methyltransferase [Clostridiaceae bacterium]
MFDTIRSPYDIAHIIQIANAIDCVIYTAGKNSIPFNLPKIQSKVKSWNITEKITEIHYETFEEAIADLKSKGKYLIGTSGNTNKIFYDLNLPESQDIVVVFGTETSGLTDVKQAMLDTTVKLPMDKSKVDFLTLPVAVSAIAYELYRRYNF